MADCTASANTVSEVRPLPDPFLEGEAGAASPITREALARVAVVAAGVGARFEREAVRHDPVAWLMAPRAMFDGECALDACRDPRGFVRALVLNAPGAGLGLDADPALLDELARDECGHAGDFDVEVDADHLVPVGVADLHDVHAMPRHDPPRPPGSAAIFSMPSPRRRARRSRERLYSATFVRYDAGGRVLVFAAAVVDGERAFRNRLFDRYGAMAALGADVREGFDLHDRIASRLVSDQMADLLAALAAAPMGTTAEGFVVLAEQRA